MTAIRKTREIFDEASGNFFCTYEARSIKGGVISAEIPREDQRPEMVAGSLLKKGGLLPKLKDRQDLLISAIASEVPICHRATRNGWWGDNRRFVSGLSVCGAQSDDIELLPPAGRVANATARLQMRGTLEGWKENTKLAKHSTTMIVSLCAAFAAPVIRLVHRSSFGLVLYGPSRVGKSTAQLLAASALGFRDEDHLPTLNATFAGLLDLAMAFNDHLLPINELGTARCPKRDLHKMLRESTYSLTSGSDIIRHPSWSGSQVGEPASSKVILLLSSEHSPDVWAAKGGETRDDGETARMIGVPVIFNGARTVFDRAPPMTNEKHDALAKKWFGHIRQAVQRHGGVAFRDYTAWIAEDVNGTTEDALSLIALVERYLTQPGMSDVARDIVSKFGVLYAGGILAVRANILPLDEKTIGSAIGRACRAALNALPDAEGDLRADFECLKAKLSGPSILDLESCTGKERRLMQSADGYHEVQQRGGRHYVVRAEVFTSWFSSEPRLRRLLERLDDEGLLRHKRERKPGRSNEWAQQQVTWPNETRVRSIVVFLPTGMSDLHIAG